MSEDALRVRRRTPETLSAFLCLGLLALVAAHSPAHAQPADSTVAPSAPPSGVVSQEDIAERARAATLRSLVVPGWGQVYNDQPLKAPLVVAALGGAVAVVVATNNEYLRYRRAYRYVSREQTDPQTPDPDNPFAEFASVWRELGSPGAAATRGRRDQLRGRRDISILAVTAVYALQALDAYVAANLADFDVSDDISLRLAPVGPSLGVHVSL